MRNLMDFSVQKRNCTGEEEGHLFTTVRYYLKKQTAEMKCTRCNERYFRRMNDTELFMYRNEEKLVLDIESI